MNQVASGDRKVDLSHAAAIIALAIGMAAAAALLYVLLDILLVFFLGVVIAAALQPAHVRLSRWGIPKGLAVLLIYLLFIAAIVLIVVFVGPILVEQISTFATDLPQQYADFVTQLQASSTPFVRTLGERLPSFTDLTQRITALAPSIFDNVLQVMASTVSFLSYFVVVLAIGFYWTMELPHLERLVLSFLPTARRPQMLEIWREIESKLGAFIRGQGLAMLAIGVASAVGYFVIGLPNVLVLAILAGLFEAVPLIGPILGAAPAVLLALPQGVTSALLVVGFSTLLQLFENNVLIPRIMSRTVGVSELVSLFAVLALGVLYGFLGIFIAIPLTVVVQVLLDHTVINPEPAPDDIANTNPLSALRTRMHLLRQQIRQQLRERGSWMKMDAVTRTPDQAADVLNQQIEQAVEQVENVLTTAQQNTSMISAEERKAVVAALQQTTRKIEQIVGQIDAVLPTTGDPKQTPPPTVAAPVLTELQQTAQQVKQSVQHAEIAVNKVQERTPEAQPLAEKNSHRSTNKQRSS